MTGKPDIEGLERFSRRVSRRLTEFFAGRKHEIDFITKRVEEVARMHREGTPAPGKGTTVLITGVPGAGKTALMDRLGAGWSDPEGDGPLGVNVELDHLRSAGGLAAAVREQLPGGFGERVASAFGSFSLNLLGVGVELREPRDAGLRGLERPTVLFIDEIQRIPSDKQAPEVRVLNALHLGNHGAPVVPVLAGLADTVDALSNVRISRFDPARGLSLGRLSYGAACESAGKFLDRFNVAGDRSGWPGTVAAWSDGWPMHLHNTLRALAGELARNGGDLDRLDRLQAKRAAAVHRAAYYGERTGAGFQDEPDMLAAVMEQTGEDGLARRAIAEILVKHGGHCPAGMTPADAFKALLARGLLQRTPVVEDHLHSCPIPSLRSWCAARTGNRLHRPAMTGNTVLVEAGIAGGEDPNGRDVRGRTPLHIATEEGWPDIARLLLDAGADPSIRDNEGRTPAAAARRPPAAGMRAINPAAGYSVLSIAGWVPVDGRHLLEHGAGGGWRDEHPMPLVDGAGETVGTVHPATGEVRDGAGMKLAPAPEPDDGPSFGM